MAPVRFEPTISASQRPQTYALDLAATGTGTCYCTSDYIIGQTGRSFYTCFIERDSGKLTVFLGGRQYPSGPGTPHYRGFYITHNDGPQPVGLNWSSDQLVA